jgi:hypothetical protein
MKEMDWFMYSILSGQALVHWKLTVATNHNIYIYIHE